MRIILTMERTKIERYVVDLLTVSAVNRDGGERSVYDTLYHLLMAVASYEQLSDDEKELVTSLKKKLQYFFCARFSLKERKETKKKKNFPPNPLIKEKAKKETEEKVIYIAGGDRREVFHQECLKRLGQYDPQRLADFYNFYSEENPSTGKMRFEEERYWNIDKRLKRWMNTEYSAANTAAAIRMKRLEKKQKQQAVAQTRQEDNERVWQEIEERKKGAVSREEWLAMKKEKESDEAG